MKVSSALPFVVILAHVDDACARPLAQGEKTYTGSVDGVDVSATMHDKFQQSSLHTGWCGASLQFLDRVVDIAVCSETGTHSVKLCILGWIDMPVVVHVKVVDYPLMAQRLFPLVQCSRPLRFRCCRFSSFSGAGLEKLVEIPHLLLVEAGHCR